MKHLDGGHPGRRGPGDSLGHQPSGQLVLAVRQAYRNIPTGPPVQLRWAPRTRPRPAGQPRVVALQQALGFQPVQVKLRLVARDANSVRGLVAAHRSRPRAHELIQLVTYGVGERSDSGGVVSQTVQKPLISNR